jgi:uncharacterized protein
VIIVDTGPLVALLNRRDGFHAWAASTFASLREPLATCEPVIAEACYLLGPKGAQGALALCERAFITVSFSLQSEVTSVRRLMDRYLSVPMSVADACLVRMSELTPTARVLTLDGDFAVYRRNGRQVIQTIMPS